MAKIDNELQFIVENALNDKMSLIEKSESRYRNIIDFVCEKINLDSNKKIMGEPLEGSPAFFIVTFL